MLQYVDLPRRILPISYPKSMSLVDLGKQLLEAAKLGLTEQVRYLMSNGAPFTTDWLGNSPLHFAALHGHVETSEALMRAGISRDARTKVDRTPLHIASQHGHLAIVQLLIANGADVNAIDMLRMTPLHWAAEKGHNQIAEYLLGRGAIANNKNKFQKTPVDIAYYNGYADLVELLLQSLHGSVITENESGVVEEVTTTVCDNNSDAICYLPFDTNLQSSDSVITFAQLPVQTTAELNKKSSPNRQEDHTSAEDLATLAALAEASSVITGQAEVTPVSASQVDATCVTSSHARMSANDTLTWLETHGLVTGEQTSMVTSMLDSGQMVVLTEAGNLILNTACSLANKTDCDEQPSVSEVLTLNNQDQFRSVVSTSAECQAVSSNTMTPDDVSDGEQESMSRKRKFATSNLNNEDTISSIYVTETKLVKIHSVDDDSDECNYV